MSTQVSNEKPTLNGVRIRTRKRDAKAKAKYEPEVFRDSIFQLIEDIDPTDYSKISDALDAGGNTLDYHRYGDVFFDILVTGGLIAPGGIIQDDEELGKVPFSLFVLGRGDNQQTGARHWGDLIHKLTRRYKYLESKFAESSVHVLRHIHRYSEEENKILATGVAVLVSDGFLTMEPLKALKEDHLTKDGLALRFLTEMLRVYLADNSINQLHKALVRAKVGDLIMFFPPNKRDEDCFARHFEAEDMPELIELHAKTVTIVKRGELIDKVASIIREGREEESEDDEQDEREEHIKATNISVVREAKLAMRANKWEEPQTIVLVWDGIMNAVNWSFKAEHIEAQVLKQIHRHSEVLEVLTTEPKSEIALLKHVQLYAHGEPRLTKYFGRIVLELYNTDVLSDSAIIFWFTKGAKPEGKSGFLKQTEALVRKLEALEADEESEEED
ncbi:ARM repeat-containing protein [Coemansia reversa NRRL 1564]|uniref:ARM repeat-containing protein n=1 Tax=Coemansia reversa (strain ATCC 12441 / NRRL 1564) TaxID=763665 RepID=A0A2G5BGA7_COERN|nr:ARM repeat-containing protein [Coemansia reversa NRRL 1564]|eukprot:PIA17737.1 ARM repeat-containing protein [Coemansia reversa NRRL 1564]